MLDRLQSTESCRDETVKAPSILSSSGEGSWAQLPAILAAWSPLTEARLSITGHGSDFFDERYCPRLWVLLLPLAADAKCLSLPATWC